MVVPKVPRILYGGDYNPEQWPEGVWLDDAHLMKEAGVNIVSLGIFSWATLEPREGDFSFGWLDSVIEILHDHGVAIALATPTASPPPWLAARHPEILPVTARGERLWPGSRCHFCPSSPAYRAACTRIVKQLAERYGTHPALAMWHIGNEYGSVAPCHCDISAADFRSWLERRYGTIDALNEAWGTAFWSQRYDAWEEINPPRSAPTFINPTQQLDFKRFTSDAFLGCFENETAILRRATPDIPIATNFMGFFKPLDYWEWAAREDVVANDSYPEPLDDHAQVNAAMTHDLMRSLGGGNPWVLMEQAPSQVNWRLQNPVKRPGQMRLWSYSALARGADGIMFFQWRAARAGAEKFHSGMIPHAPREETRVWREVKTLGGELAALAVLRGSRVHADVAIMFDWESWWALELEARPSSDLRLLDAVRSFYQPLYEANIAVDFVRPGADLGNYKLVLVPNLYLVRDEAAQHICRYVEAGGTILMSFFSGIVDEHDHIRLGGYPAPFRNLLGLWIEEFDPYVRGKSNTIRHEDGSNYTCSLWSDVIHLEGAEALATYEGDFYAGSPAITRHQYRNGLTYYLGTRPDEQFMQTFLRDVCAKAGIEPPLAAPAGVEVIRRQAGGRSFLFLLNYSGNRVEAQVPAGAKDLITNATSGSTVSLDPHDVVILETSSGM